jgi:hypothetical protein
MEHLQSHFECVLKPGDVVSPTATTSLPSIAPITEIRWRRRWEQIHDVDGTLWDVHDARATGHGFDLLFGFVANSRLTGAAAQKRARPIATEPLVAYWDANRVNGHAIFDLPANRTALQSLRRKLGFNFFKDRRALWQTRSEDLKNLPINEFAKRYNVDSMNAYVWRFLLLGRMARPLNWWNTPETLAILRSPGTSREIGGKLGISGRHAFHLRRVALTPPGEPIPDDSYRPFPKRWKTPAALGVLRSGLSNREVAQKLAISLSHAWRLRRLLAQESGQKL